YTVSSSNYSLIISRFLLQLLRMEGFLKSSQCAWPAGLLVCRVELERFRLHLPGDVVQEILLRLGADSLVVCERRGNLWCALIKSQSESFVDEQLGFNKSLFFKWTRPLDDIFIGHLSKQVQSLVTISKDEADLSASLPLVPRKPDNLAAFDSHGIICLFDSKRKHLAVLCNPALRIFNKSLPLECDSEAEAEAAVVRKFGLYLPEEVVEEILVRLPPESLMVNKCVSKFWYELINRPSFVNKHLRFNIEKRDNSSVCLFLKWTRQELSLQEIFIGHIRVRNRHQDDLSKQVLSLVTISRNDAGANTSAAGDHLPCVIEQVSLPPSVVEQVSLPPYVFERDPLPPVHKQIENLAAICCHGIICLFDAQRRSSAILCNPALRVFKILRPPHCIPGFMFEGLGLGYDPIANVYKFVCIFAPMDPDAGLLRAEVYTLGTDSWREIVAPKDRCFLYSKGVYCRGFFYWWNVRDDFSKILSFDMSKEEFHFIPVPDAAVGGNGKLHELVVWNESLVIFFSTELSWFSTCFEMWVMVDTPRCNGVEASTYWTKHLTIGPLARIYGPLAFWKDDELLMESWDGLIVSYNLHTQKLRKLPIPGAVYPGLTHASLCFKSLVLF
ncbi:hypothetical protein TorRG33x02_029400, partial [Trema orientale]